MEFLERIIFPVKHSPSYNNVKYNVFHVFLASGTLFVTALSWVLLYSPVFSLECFLVQL